jgi:hypothetical protein
MHAPVRQLWYRSDVVRRPTADRSGWEENLNMPLTASATESTSVAPERSLSQRMDALSEANDIRKKRSKLKREIKARKVDAVRVVQEVPDYCKTMKVSELLMAIPKVGKVKCKKVMASARIKPSRTLSGIPDSQRNNLIREIQKLPGRRTSQT